MSLIWEKHVSEMFRIKFKFCKRIIVEYALGKKTMDTTITVYIFFLNWKWWVFVGVHTAIILDSSVFETMLNDDFSNGID